MELVGLPAPVQRFFRAVLPRDGTMSSVRAEARGRTVAGNIVMTPWEGRWSDVKQHGDMRLPMTGEAAWLTPQGREPYWRGTITSLRHDRAR